MRGPEDIKDKIGACFYWKRASIGEFRVHVLAKKRGHSLNFQVYHDGNWEEFGNKNNKQGWCVGSAGGQTPQLADHNNHRAKCGKLNLFTYNQHGCDIRDL